jgi:hypothetical protein
MKGRGHAAGVQIEVRESKSLEETADWLAMSASAVLHELFPDQWQQAMTLMVQRINETVAEGIVAPRGPADQ